MQTEMIHGVSRNFKNMLELADEYAATSWPILITGETGVGKELIAKRIHEKSDRSDRLFFPINCGALPSGIFESELFGFEKGAFTGATQLSKGIVRQTDGGTLFLDEIGELDPALQAKLLRVVEEGEVRALGSGTIQKVDVRIVAATNVELHSAVREKKFRQDLYQRLSVLVLEIPPLRERKDDIPLLIRHFASALGCDCDEFAIDIMQEHDWPGNIRQLKNVVTRLAIFGRGKINGMVAKDILDRERLQSQSFALASGQGDGTLEAIEKQVIMASLHYYHGNRRKTAERLGIAKSTLHEKLKKWGELNGLFAPQ